MERLSGPQAGYLYSQNYLTADELDSLNRLVVVFLETAELRAKNRQVITMDFWRENVDRILEFNDQPLLTGSGSVSNAQMERADERVYGEFHAARKMYEAQLADEQDDEELKQLEKAIRDC